MTPTTGERRTPRSGGDHPDQAAQIEAGRAIVRKLEELLNRVDEDLARMRGGARRARHSR